MSVSNGNGVNSLVRLVVVRKKLRGSEPATTSIELHTLRDWDRLSSINFTPSSLLKPN